MYDTLRQGRFDQESADEAIQEFNAELETSEFPAEWPQWRKHMKVAQDCAHRWLQGGSHRCVVCGERAPVRYSV